MAGKAEKRGEESWIPDELASVTDISGKHRLEAEVDDQSAEWIPEGLPDRPTAPKVKSPKPDRSTRERDAPPEPAPEVVSRLRDTEEMLILAQQRAREAEEQGERLSDELEHLERKLKKRAAEAQARVAAAEEKAVEETKARQPEAPVKPKLSSAPASKPAAQPRRKAPAPRPPRGEKVDLNGVTFEGLRALGLSITQSARLIAQRDERGGFRTLRDLDSVWGMPHETLDLVKQSTYV